MNVQTIFIYPNGRNAEIIINFLYQPINDELIIDGITWIIFEKTDEIDTKGYLVRKIKLTK